MLSREINVIEVLRDIRAGKSDGELMRKYRLSPRGLMDLYRQLMSKGFLVRNGAGFVISRSRRIQMSQLVADLKTGLSKQELTAKYLCSWKRLRRLVTKLLAMGVITQADLVESKSLPEGIGPMPRLPRNYLPYPFPVYVVGDPDATGLIMDITENGLKVEGLETRVGETKMLSVIATDVSEARPFFLEVKCRWITKDPQNVCTAGFEISSASDHSLRELRKFIQALTPGAW